MSDTTSQLQNYINQLRAGDESARQLLMEHAFHRLRQLVRKRFQNDRLKRWEQTDDLVQRACLKLWESLKTMEFDSVDSYFRLASVQIRRQLVDLGRHYYGKRGPGRRHQTDRGGTSAPPVHQQQPDGGMGPEEKVQWSELFEVVDQLPEEQGRLFDLLVTQGLSHAEAAQMLGMSLRTLSRRWLKTRQAVYELVRRTSDSDLPEFDRMEARRKGRQADDGRGDRGL